MPTNQHMNEIGDASVLTRSNAPQVDERAIGEADLHAITALDVVGQGHSKKKAPAGEGEGQRETSLRDVFSQREVSRRMGCENWPTPRSDVGLQTIGWWLRNAGMGKFMPAPSEARENEAGTSPASAPSLARAADECRGGSRGAWRPLLRPLFGRYMGRWLQTRIRLQRPFRQHFNLKLPKRRRCLAPPVD